MKDFRIVIPSNETEWDLYYNLRFEVLRKAWGQPENSVKDEWEDISLHVLVLDKKNEAIATGRLQFNSEIEGQIRSMAVKEGYRGMGLGTFVLHYLEDRAKEKKISKIVLDARDSAVSFYKNNGYSVEGDSYVLFGVIPHARMSKYL